MGPFTGALEPDQSRCRGGRADIEIDTLTTINRDNTGQCLNWEKTSAAQYGRSTVSTRLRLISWLERVQELV